MERKLMKVEIEFTEPLLGTVPQSKDIYTNYIASLAPKPSLADEEIETVEDVEDKGWTGFHTDKDGPFLYDYQIKGFLKEAANILKQELNIKQAKSRVDNYVFVFPRRVHFKGLADANLVPLERPLRGMTPRGERVTLVRSDQVPVGTTIQFEILILPNPKGKESSAITVDVVEKLLDFGTLKGIGQWRNGGYGRFTWNKIEKK